MVGLMQKVNALVDEENKRREAVKALGGQLKVYRAWAAESVPARAL
jgi:hypothetical protein